MRCEVRRCCIDVDVFAVAAAVADGSDFVAEFD